MRNLEKLRVKNKEVEIEGEKFKLYGLSFPELAKFAALIDKQGTEEGVNHLLKISLRKSVTKEEVPNDKFDEFINGLSSSSAVKVINAVKELSGLDQEAPAEKKAV